jgi:hypothetical protein
MSDAWQAPDAATWLQPEVLTNKQIGKHTRRSSGFGKQTRMIFSVLASLVCLYDFWSRDSEVSEFPRILPGLGRISPAFKPLSAV